MTEQAAPSLLDVNLDDVKEFTTVPDNSEMELTITRGTIDPSKSRIGRHNLHLILDAGDPTVDDIHQYIPIPTDAWKSEDLKSYQKGVNRFSDMCKCFGIEMPIQTEQLSGLKGWCIIGEEEDRDSRMRNSIRRYVLSSS